MGDAVDDGCGCGGGGGGQLPGLGPDLAGLAGLLLTADHANGGAYGCGRSHGHGLCGSLDRSAPGSERVKTRGNG